MALNNLSSSLIQNTYGKLVQTEGGLIADGTGSAIDSLTVTASFAVTASHALNVPVTSSYALTASFAENAGLVAGAGANSIQSAAHLTQNPPSVSTGGIGIGDSATAGIDGVTIGNGTSAGSSGVAIGHDANSNDGGYGVSIGFRAHSQGYDSVAIGSEPSASAQQAIAIGYQADASAQGAIALGHNAEADNQNNVALGKGAQATNGTALDIRVNNASILTATTTSQDVTFAANVSASGFTGDLTGNADTATSASFATTASYAENAVVPTLQEVTDQGATTTTPITASSIFFDGLIGDATINVSGIPILEGFEFDGSTVTAGNGHTVVDQYSNYGLVRADNTESPLGLILASDSSNTGYLLVADDLITANKPLTVTGAVTASNALISGDLVVNGTGSFAYIQSVTGSAKIIGDSFLILNNDTPTQPYAGIKVQDSGSTDATASYFWNANTDDWMYEYEGDDTDHGVTLFGPEFADKDTPAYPGNNVIQKGTGGHHLTGSILQDDGVTISYTSPVTAFTATNLLVVSESNTVFGDVGVLSVSTDGSLNHTLEVANVGGKIRTEGIELNNLTNVGRIQTRQQEGHILSEDNSIMLQWTDSWMNVRGGGAQSSTAIGWLSSAGSENSVAIGSSANANGESIAIGFGADASKNSGGTGEGCIAIGNSADANNKHGIAIGDNARVSGSTAASNMLAMGHDALVTASETAVFKYDNFNFSGSGTATFTGDVTIEGALTADNFTVANTLSGSNYIFVQATGTAIENGAALKAAYNLATGSTPNGSALAVSNRMVVLVAPGNYEFESSDFVLDTEYVDVVSLDGERSVNIVDFDSGGYTIDINTNHTFVRGFDCTAESNLAFKITFSGGSGIRVENCKGHNNSFGTSQEISGFFKDCECSGDIAFAGNGGTASGTFIRCSVGNLMLGSFSGTMSGLAENCSATYNLSGYCDNNNGTWMNCDSDSEGWRNGVASSGRVFYCRGGDNSFGISDGQVTGKLFYCVKTATTDPEFFSPGSGGKIIACVDGNDDFVNISG